RELDRNPRAVPGQAGYRQQVAVAIAARSRFHRVAKSAPVPGTQVFGNDEVERLAGGPLRREAENPLRAGIQNVMRPSRSVAMIASEALCSRASPRPAGIFIVRICSSFSVSGIKCRCCADVKKRR